MLTLVNSYSEISLNVIRFLTDRIAFLNKKISTFSEKSTMQRLCSYLIGEYEKHGEVIPFSPTKISAKINVGRASVYRDTARLVELGYAAVDDKTIILKCPMGLERILK